MKRAEASNDNPPSEKEDVGKEAPIKLPESPESPKSLRLSDKERLQELCSIRWNIAFIAISTMLVTCPVSGLITSTTTLLSDKELGPTSLAASSIAQLLASALLLSYANKIIGVQKMVLVTPIVPLAFILSFAYPSWYTTLPSCILLGLGLAFFASTFMYGSSVGYYYSQLTNGNADNTIVIISGFLAGAFSTGFLFGYGIVFVVLNMGLEDENSTVTTHISQTVCGPNYCNEEMTNLTTMKQPETVTYYALISSFAATAAAGGIISLFVRDFSAELGCTLRKKSEYFTIMKETLGLMKHPRGYLLIIMTVFIGLEEAFIASDYMQAYISCTLGIPKVGLVILIYGVTQVVVFLSQGLIVQILGRVFLIVCGTSMILVCCLVLLIWKPESDPTDIFFAIVVVWASADAAIIPSLVGLYAILFEDNIEGSLSFASFWQGLGFNLGLICSQFLCIYIKLYVIIGVGCLGLICYLVLELLVGRSNKTNFKLM